ncbi:hypothetical protein pb186bvf_009036 [Paramecium bursaria]
MISSQGQTYKLLLFKYKYLLLLFLLLFLIRFNPQANIIQEEFFTLIISCYYFFQLYDSR